MAFRRGRLNPFVKSNCLKPMSYKAQRPQVLCRSCATLSAPPNFRQQGDLRNLLLSVREPVYLSTLG